MVRFLQIMSVLALMASSLALPDSAFADDTYCQDALAKNVSLTRDQEVDLGKQMARFGAYLMRGQWPKSQTITRISVEEDKLHVYVTLSFSRKKLYTVAILNSETKAVERLIGPSLSRKFAQGYAPF